MNNIKSSMLPVTCGIPQGSTLGPLLFLLYINDIGKALKSCKYLLYADDTVLYTSDTNTAQANQNMNSDLQLIQQWCCDNSLTTNTKKTKVMGYSLNRNIHFKNEYNCKLLGQTLEVVDKYKYLGIILDIHLTYKPHVKSVITGFFLGTRPAGFPRRFSNCRIKLTMKGPFPHLLFVISHRLFEPQKLLTYQIKANIFLYL